MCKVMAPSLPDIPTQLCNILLGLEMHFISSSKRCSLQRPRTLLPKTGDAPRDKAQPKRVRPKAKPKAQDSAKKPSKK